MSTRIVGVVGAGNMGSGIAQKAAMEGFQVILVDLDESAAKRGHERIRTLLAEGVERRIFDEGTAKAIADRVRPSGKLESLADVEIVIEAVFEDLNVKRDLFTKLDAICSPRTILATNTSSFTVDDVASVTKRPERVVGLHYFYHPAKNRLVEVIPGSKTSEETRSRAWTFTEMTGKTPIHSATFTIVHRVSGASVGAGGTIFTAHPLVDTGAPITVPSTSECARLSVTHALPSRSNFGPNAYSW
jgi:enoyl-CoA hydratase/3-hydroxyacyl-CoA dehydrogenase